MSRDANMNKARSGANDKDLIERIAQGDRVAIQALFARHHPRVYRFVLRQVGNEAVAEELSNEVFLEAWRQAGRFEGRAAVTTWLMSIAYNKAVSSLRKRTEAQLNEQHALAIADPADTPEMSAQKNAKATALRDAMEHLSPDHKAVLDLVYYHEMSVAEVADVLGIPANTVKTRMFHARKRLCALLEAAGIDRGWP